MCVLACGIEGYFLWATWVQWQRHHRFYLPQWWRREHTWLWIPALARPLCCGRVPASRREHLPPGDYLGPARRADTCQSTPQPIAIGASSVSDKQHDIVGSPQGLKISTPDMTHKP